MPKYLYLTLSLSRFLYLLVFVFFFYTFNAYPLDNKNVQELRNKAGHLLDIGKYDEALECLESLHALQVSYYGESHQEPGWTLSGIARVLLDKKDYRGALSRSKKANDILSKKLGKSHPNTLQSLEVTAGIYFALGDYKESIKLREDILAIANSIYGKNNVETMMQTAALGLSYSLGGIPEKGIKLMEDSLCFFERKLGKENHTTLSTRSNLSVAYINIGDFQSAIRILTETLKIESNLYGESSHELLELLFNLSSAYSKMKSQESLTLSMEYLSKAQEIIKTTFGENSIQYIETLNNEAGLYESVGMFKDAIELWNQILDRTKQDKSLLTRGAFYNLANAEARQKNYHAAIAYAEKSYELSERISGKNSTEYLQSLQLYGLLIYLTSDYADNIKLQEILKKSIKTINFHLKSILFFDESNRLSWQDKNLDKWLICALSPCEIANLSLSWKGIVLESLAEDRAIALATSSNKNGSATLNKLKELQTALSKIAFEQGYENESIKIQEQIASLQRELASKYLGQDRQRNSASITISDIMPALSGGGALVDFIQFRDPKLEGEKSTCLGAIITGEDNTPIFVRIDGGAAINRAIDSLRAATNQGNSIEVEAQTKFLSEKLWSPIAAKIPEGTKRLFLCPDAKLNFLSFTALLESDGRFVAEKYPITYIGSARDLAKKPSGKILKSMALVANPQFDAAAKNAKTTELVTMRSAEANVFGSIALPPLPGTEAEATSLQALAAESGWQTKSYLGKDATETSVRNTKKPGVLHLATHGFYLNSFTPPGPEGSRGMSVVGIKETTEEKKKKEKGVDPMRASGVAFTGAQQTLTSWSQRKAPNPETDGVLTAEEVGALRLDGTWMVVLSACETGVGEARSGEGVFGLRRAFMIAGAENLLMTLWPVADETTAKIMTDFYKEAFASGDASGSLAIVQRDWLVKLRQERGLLAAVREAGPFAMVTMTNPNAKREFVEGQIEIAPEKAAMPKSDKILEFQVALSKADAGNAYAQAVVSIYYGLGLGCDQDFAKSKEYVMLSAKQQNPLGIYRLAEMRESGEGMDQNTDQATQLMQKAKSGLQKLSNDPYAMTALAAIYERENPASPKVRELLTKASDMGYEPAQTKLSQIQTNP